MKFFKSLDKSRIRVLSFDLDNTIYDCESVLREAEKWFTEYLCERYGLGGEYQSYDYWARVKSNILKNEPELEDDVTLLRAKSLLEAFKSMRYPLKGGMNEAMELLGIFIKKRSSGVVEQEVIKLLEDLAEKYPVVSISNGNLDIEILGVKSNFCYDLRPVLSKLHRKPHPDLFKECARLYGIGTSEILHIGDDPYTDVYGSVMAGCQSVLLYKGYQGKSPDHRYLKVLPEVCISNILELRKLLID
ncbi:MAG: HAD-IA family hydrolase [Succinivibrio sp.]